MKLFYACNHLDGSESSLDCVSCLFLVGIWISHNCNCIVIAIIRAAILKSWL